GMLSLIKSGCNCGSHPHPNAGLLLARPEDATMTPYTDDAQLPQLTRRQEEILSCIVRAYTETPEPISSKHLVENYKLGVSTATVRNEMAVLEELGYIAAPHTSAGRIPTETGYRYFVRQLISVGDLPAAEQARISQKLRSLPL